LGEDNSDPIKVHPELNGVVATKIFLKNLGREHMKAPNAHGML